MGTVIDEIADEVKEELALDVRRRYANAKVRFELGIWGRPLNLLKGVELTTRGNYRNNWADMVQDNRDLRKRMRKEGILAEDCFCAEWSPKNHLLHLHGFYRLVEPMPASELHGYLSDYWERIHGAPVVWVQDIYSADGLMKYNLKHALKNYVNYEFCHMGTLKSKGWLPLGWKRTRNLLVSWALAHGAKWSIDDMLGLDYNRFDEWVAFAWDVMREYMYRWCNNEVITLDFKEGQVMVAGDRVYDLGSEEYR